MKLRCPCCGAENSLDALIAHEGARTALWELTKMGDEMTRLAVTYISMFRPAKSALTFERMAKLLAEIRVDMDAAAIERNGKTYAAPREAWIYALRTVIDRRATGQLALPLKSHGYLYEVIAAYQPAPANVPVLAEASCNSQNPAQTMTATSGTLNAAAVGERYKR